MEEQQNKLSQKGSETFVNRLLSINSLFLLANLVLALCFFGRLDSINLRYFFNSDTLYLPALYKDWFVDNNSMQGWHLNPAPNFFPDMLVYFIMMFLGGGDFILVSFLFGLIQYFLILYLMVRLFKKVVPGQPRLLHAVIYLFVSLWLMEVVYPTGNFMFAYFLFINAYHTGCFIMTLCCFLLVLRIFDRATTARYWLLFALGFLSAFSDQLFLVTFVAPLALAAMFFLKNNFRVFIRLILISFLAAGLAVLAYTLIDKSGYLGFDKPVLQITLQSISDSYTMFSNLLKEYLVTYFGYRSIAILLFMASFIGMIYLFIRHRRSGNNILRFFLLFIIVQTPLVIFAPILCGNFTGSDTLRYNIYPLYLTGLNVAVFMALTVKQAVLLGNGFKYTLTVLGIALLLAGEFRYNHDGLRQFFSYYPEPVRRIDEVAEKEGLLNGVGNYWQAKLITMFSKKGVRVCSVYDDLLFYPHVANNNWYFNEKNRFNFILLNEFRDTSAYRKRFTQHTEIKYYEPELKLVKTNTFVYDPWTFVPKTEQGQ